MMPSILESANAAVTLADATNSPTNAERFLAQLRSDHVESVAALDSTPDPSCMLVALARCALISHGGDGRSMSSCFGAEEMMDFESNTMDLKLTIDVAVHVARCAGCYEHFIGSDRLAALQAASSRDEREALVRVRRRLAGSLRLRAADAFRTVLEGRTILDARRQAGPSRAPSAARRRPATIGAVFAFVLIFLAGVGVGSLRQSPSSSPVDPESGHVLLTPERPTHLPSPTSATTAALPPPLRAASGPPLRAEPQPPRSIGVPAAVTPRTPLPRRTVRGRPEARRDGPVDAPGGPSAPAGASSAGAIQASTTSQPAAPVRESSADPELLRIGVFRPE